MRILRCSFARTNLAEPTCYDRLRVIRLRRRRRAPNSVTLSDIYTHSRTHLHTHRHAHTHARAYPHTPMPTSINTRQQALYQTPLLAPAHAREHITSFVSPAHYREVLAEFPLVASDTVSSCCSRSISLLTLRCMRCGRGVVERASTSAHGKSES